MHRHPGSKLRRHRPLLPPNAPGRLLGKACRKQVPLSVSIANPEFAGDIELMERLAEDGIGLVKRKTGFNGDDFDLERAEIIRTRFPEFGLRIDYNQGLDSATALGGTLALSEAPLSYLISRVMLRVRPPMPPIRGGKLSGAVTEMMYIGLAGRATEVQ